MACKLDAFMPRLNVILLGKSGVGKSATGNTVLGRPAFISKRSSTSTTRTVQMKNGDIDGVSVDVYDTPGFFNTEITNEDVMKECRTLLPLDGWEPTVFLLVIPVSRFTPEDRKAVEEAQKILGERHSQNTWILFTRGDTLERDGLSAEEFLQNSTHLKEVVERFSHRYHVFNNSTQNPGQVRELLDKIRELSFLKFRIPWRMGWPSWNFVLLGKSGAGKSASANTMLCQSRFTSKPGFRSVTRSTQKETGTLGGLSFNVFDTPGLYSTAVSQEEVIREYRCLSLLADSAPTVFLLVLRAEGPTQEDLRAVQDIQDLLGDQLLQNTWILFTRGDTLERDGLSADEFLQNSTHLKEVVERFSHRYHVFNNSTQNPGQVRELLDKIRELFRIPGRMGWPSWNFVLLGKSGAGKSSSANTMLCQSRFASKPGFRSVTRSTQKETGTLGCLSFNVFDTPGLYSTAVSQEEVIREYRCLSLLADSAPTVFLMVLRAEGPTQEDLRAVQDIQDLLGDQLLQNTWILFTRGDELERDGISIEEFIEETEELKRVVQRFKNRIHVFNNRTDDPDQVRRLMEKILKRT